MQTRIHHLAVWILVIIHQAVGFGWYAIFGNTWLNLHAREMTDIERTHNIGAYVFAVIAAIIVNYALAWLVSRMHAHTAAAGLRIALFCWFSFLFAEFATVALFSAFETNPWPLVLIDMGRPLVAWSISGLVLGAWRKSV
jgi:mannose/fructose/N-acetylgalactosamine-specific phosphotransferase system component IIC